jgi:hypothetical protein
MPLRLIVMLLLLLPLQIVTLLLLLLLSLFWHLSSGTGSAANQACKVEVRAMKNVTLRRP